MRGGRERKKGAERKAALQTLTGGKDSVWRGGDRKEVER